MLQLLVVQRGRVIDPFLLLVVGAGVLDLVAELLGVPDTAHADRSIVFGDAGPMEVGVVSLQVGQLKRKQSEEKEEREPTPISGAAGGRYSLEK